MKGDRFEKLSHDLVQKMMGADALDLTAASLDMVQGDEKLVVALLRKEHATVRSEVLAYRRKLNYGHVVPSDKHAKGRIDGSIETCNDILSALDKRAKGGTK